ncbi:FGGY carbohydrate kinase domain-containing protein-like [Salmo trutta]|uniref:FGGY carbohydrate kinase domain-containing protein-like n=1 Tax=Salmo trutta TaxID=8032 RepID=UPI00112FD81B|nr:FGGY carbohydrate kinase domain-containing protein-like [Salmo trutta]
MRETCWCDAAHFLDLLDFLSWKDTGSLASQGPLIVPGVWRPYLSAMVPDLWLNEGGQSATGRLVSSALLRLGPARSGLFNLRPLALQSCCFVVLFSFSIPGR